MEQISLSLKKNIIHFDLMYSFSYIRINKIIVTSLMKSKPNEWINTLMNMNLIINYSDKESSKFRTIPLNLVSRLSPNHMQPIFDIDDFEVPLENVRNITALGNYINKLNIELKYFDILPPDTCLTIFYDASPGVISLKND